MTKNNFVTKITAISIFSLALLLAGCSGTTVSNTANTANTNRMAVNSNVNTATVNTSVNVAAPNTSMTNMNNASAPNANRKPVAAVKEPTPQIGTGANDLLLFTQARGAFGDDKELLNGVIIETKDGNVTLSGKVSSAEQKAKAEQLIKAVNGVKGITNKISVSK